MALSNITLSTVQLENTIATLSTVQLENTIATLSTIWIVKQLTLFRQVEVHNAEVYLEPI